MTIFMKHRYVRASVLILGATLVGSGQTAADQVIPDDLIVQGSTCTGLDCVNNENFGFDTLKLKENNTRIKFEDTSSLAGFPTTDWQLTANDSASGGANKFSIEDITGAKVPFTVTAGAASNAFFIASNSKVGLRTAAPVLDLHINTGDTPAHRLEQNSSSGFTAQTWDIAGNEANFFVRDVTGGSRLPLRIRPGAPTSSLDIASTGNVGMGTAGPQKLLHLNAGAPTIRVQDTTTPNTGELTVASDFIGIGANRDNITGAILNPAKSAASIFMFAGAGGSDIRFATIAANNTAPVQRAVIDKNGNVGIGVAAPGSALQVNGNISVVTLPANPAGQTMCFGTQGGVANTFGTCASDIRLKRNVEYLHESAGLAAVMQLKPATYKWRDGDDRTMAGFIAQDTQRAVAEAVYQPEGAEFLSLDSTAVLAYAVKAIQELKADNDKLRSEIERLKATH